MSPTDFNRQIRQPLQRQERRLRRLRTLDGVTLTACVVIAALAVELLLDWWLRLRVDMRAALLAVVAGVGGWAAWRYLVKPLRLRFGVREMALAVEQRHPELNSLLVSAVDFSSGRVGDATANSPELVDAVMVEAAQAVRGVSFDALVDTRRSRLFAGRAIAVLAAVAVAFLAAPQTMGIWIDRNLLLRDVAWPQRTQLVVDAPAEGPIRGAIGDDVEIRAHVPEGFQVPRQVELLFETAGGAVGRETMTGVGNRGFRMVFPRARESFTFHLEGGDDVTTTFHVELSERPMILSAELTVTPPAYTGLPVETLPDGQRAVELYRGSTLTIRAQASKELAAASLYSGNVRVAELNVADRALVAEVAPEESQTYHFVLADRDGLANARPARFSARVVEDAPPKVRLAAPNVGNLVTLQAVLPLEMGITDELGIAHAWLAWERSGAAGSAQATPVTGFSPAVRTFDGRQEWSIAQTGAEIGEALTLTLRARDFNDVTGPGEGASTTLSFRIATPEELLAEFQRREQEYRRQFERLVDSQDRLRRQLLTALAGFEAADRRGDLEATLAPLERQQRQIRQQLGAVQQQFVQALAEMAINRLDEPETRTRLHDGVIEPLGALFTRDLADAADQLRRLGREPSPALAAGVDPAQAQIAGKMQSVLDNMLQWEGFQETVGMLREILQLQRELNAETKQTLEHEGSDFFED